MGNFSDDLMVKQSEATRKYVKETRLQKHEIDILQKEILCLERIQRQLEAEVGFNQCQRSHTTTK